MASLKEFLERGGDICVLDTGSTDDTVKIAKELGCRVFEENFSRIVTKEEAEAINAKIDPSEKPVIKEGDSVFNFAAARNRVTELAENDWVWHVDADEVFTKLDIDKVDEICSIPNSANISTDFIFSHLSNGMPQTAFRHCKLFNRKYLKWVNMVHECLAVVDDMRGKTHHLGHEFVKLEHFQNMETNRSGYLRGLALDTYLNPLNDRNSHYYGRELYWDGWPKSAIKEFERHVEMKKWPTEAAQSMMFIGKCYRLLGDEQKAIEWFLKSFYLESNRRVALIELCDLYLAKKDYQKVACYAAMALEIPLVYYYSNQMSHYRDIPHWYMYIAKWWLGDKKGSKEHWKKAIEYDPTNHKYIKDAVFYGEQLPDGWFLPDDIKQYRILVGGLIGGSTFIELGTWLGRSLCSVADIIKAKNLKVIAVDTFEGTSNEGHAHDLAKKISIFYGFQNNLKRFGIEDNVTIMQMTTDEAVKKVKGKYPLIFIDADHSYESIKTDITKWREKLKKGGIISGHDYSPKQWPGVVKAVTESLGEVKTGGLVWYKQL